MDRLPPFPEDLIAEIRKASAFVVIGHVSPDGDCLSSQLALGMMLSSLGKEVLLANAGPFERDEIKDLKSSFVSTLPDSYLAKKPTVIITDCSTSDRIGSLLDQITGLMVLVIDHHASGVRWGDKTFVVADSPSTTLLIQHLYHTMGVTISKEAAYRLFFGFATDTGYFKFLNANQGFALRMSAELVDLGVSPNEIQAEIAGGKRYPFIRYLGTLIDRSEQFLDGRIICTYAYLKDTDTFGDDKPSDLFYSQMLSVKGAEAVLLFKEKEDGKTEVGLRSSHSSLIDVGLLAAEFGGGGHKHASGMTVPLDIPAIQTKLLKKIEGQLA